MVQAEEVSRSFGSVRALDRVSLEVRPGEVFGLLGPNGAGKTTLVRILTGVLQPDGGRAWVAGLEVGREPHRVKARIGYATQEQSIYRDLTVEENLLFRARLYRPKEARPLAREVLERFGLLPYAHALAGHLSGGWRQRLALAQAVVHRPEVLFLDEPTTGLDPLSRRSVWELIHQEAERGAAVLVTTHYMDEAERCHRLALLFGGRVLATGTPQELKALAKARARFLYAPGLSLREARGMPGVLEAWPSGAGVRLIARREASLGGLEEVEPSLEDVFILLTKEVL
ncbi:MULTISPECIES: ABC transporter ATP-binding protein [Thermus]|jgi:ABC-2 type transport system ATP-binding protein|uniref:ABC transporter, ATP-binding protein n=1 Tax=Thermus scotoductus (strain ATCC 700910 / SA-01) TaxID=743525 RepID=E8PR22_THESS|nr:MULTISPECIES: ABC transporter ATP-binding protein [Thermus]ADW20682.1 ABC transporter, ATP-binding protein [Thermus scotoductus SA-01]